MIDKRNRAPFQDFQETNYTALRKIMKKHDKIMSRDSGADWMKRVVDVSSLAANKKMTKTMDDIEVGWRKHLSLPFSLSVCLSFSSLGGSGGRAVRTGGSSLCSLHASSTVMRSNLVPPLEFSVKIESRRGMGQKFLGTGISEQRFGILV